MIIPDCFFDALIEFIEAAICSTAEGLGPGITSGELSIDELEDSVEFLHNCYSILGKLNSGADEVELTPDEEVTLTELISNEFQTVVANTESSCLLDNCYDVLSIYKALTDEETIQDRADRLLQKPDDSNLFN